jgi:hypothetical protein
MVKPKISKETQVFSHASAREGSKVKALLDAKEGNKALV